MKVRILWAPPAEKRFQPGDILTADVLAKLGVDAGILLASGDAEMLSPPKLKLNLSGKKGS